MYREKNCLCATLLFFETVSQKALELNSVHQAGLNLRDLTASASPVLVLKTCTFFIFKDNYNFFFKLCLYVSMEGRESPGAEVPAA